MTSRPAPHGAAARVCGLHSSGTDCARTSPGRPVRAPSARRRSPTADADRRPSASRPAPAASPFRRNRPDPAAPGRTVSRTPSPHRGNARAGLALPAFRRTCRRRSSWHSSGGIHRRDSGSQASAQPQPPAPPDRPPRRADSATGPRSAPNCSGLTKIEATVRRAGATPARTSARWPSCSAPIVGTSASAPCRRAQRGAGGAQFGQGSGDQHGAGSWFRRGRQRATSRPATQEVCSMKLQGQIALITGGSRGIGRATALLFARGGRGYRVLPSGRRAEGRGNRAPRSARWAAAPCTARSMSRTSPRRKAFAAERRRTSDRSTSCSTTPA